MTDEPSHHRGIIYSVRFIGKSRWRWALHPPDGIIDYQAVSGDITGTRTAAIAVAKRQIDKQDRRVAKYIRSQAKTD